MSKDNSTRFYVYVHKRKDTGAIFYVGKGAGQRAHNKSSRNKFWKIVHRKAGGRSIEIVSEFATESEALHHELFLIWSLRVFGVKLTNLVDGGGGIPGWRHTEKAKAAMTAKRKGVPLRDSHYQALVAGVRTPEARLAKREAGLRRYSDPAQRAATQAINAEINSRPEVRQKISRSLSEARRALGQVSPVMCLTTGDCFECLADAAAWSAKQAGKTAAQARTSIIGAIRRNGTAYGYRWKYLPKINACEVSQV